MSSSVVLPMADTTATTSSPRWRMPTRRLATFLMRSGEATDVPPNFATIRAIALALLRYGTSRKCKWAPL